MGEEEEGRMQNKQAGEYSEYVLIDLYKKWI